MEFKVLRQSKKSRARLGILRTAHGDIETPAFVPVATRATVKTLTSEEAQEAGSQLLIANTYHMHFLPGEERIKKSGGLHKFMNWDQPLMTDSGGFQAFSLGFGTDHGVGKVLKERLEKTAIAVNDQPEKLRITMDGIYFRSIVDGRKLFMGPNESITIQEALGADIMFAFDECTSPLASHEYVKDSLERTHRWAKASLAARRTKQALYGITQGSHFKDLREAGARYINSLGFDGFGIGGDFGADKKMMQKVLDWTLPLLDDRMPRHFLGIGHLADMEPIVKGGADTFDCTVPTHYARRGVAFTSAGRLNLKKQSFLADTSQLDKRCGCKVCATYRKNYICHLFRAHEITGMRLLTYHNLFYFNNYVAELRVKIRRGQL